MSDLGTILTITQTLISALESSILKQVMPVFSYKSDLKRLKETVKTVENALFEARNKVELTNTELVCLQKLEDVVYVANDLFEKFFILVEHPQTHQVNDSNKIGHLFGKVRKFFSSRNQVKAAYLISRDIRNIRNRLNAVAEDHGIFRFSVETRPAMRMRETYSYVYGDVVGRKDDVTNTIDRLLVSAVEDIGFLTIVGVGGVGKTSLAKVVLGDERIKSQFPLKLWVSLSDQFMRMSLDPKHFLLKVLESIGCKLDSSTSIEYVQSTYQSKLKGNKFLLVLDDVWTEDLSKWQYLKDMLMIGGRGSRVIVTTRSRETANIIGANTYELKGLTKEDAWRLFEMTAFREPSKDPEIVEIGEKIVEKCCYVPLAIKVVGSLLNGKPIDKWQAFERNGLAGTSNGVNEIMSVLKFSYDHLQLSLKNCFAYCALFPKSYVINKEMLMNLWDAQGYIVPSFEGQSIESACEEHFSILLQRCFFDDVKKDEFGAVESFKLHDLMHDLAQNVPGMEICVVKPVGRNLEHDPHHVFDTREKIYDQEYVESKLRSYLMFEPHYVCGSESVCLDKLFKNWLCLRALAFNFISVDTLPDTIGNLLHLRYLNLANSEFRRLPDSISDLHNLRTLNLSNCRQLRYWSKTASANLTHLYLAGCENLSCMAYPLRELRNLRVLDEFPVHDWHYLQDLQELLMNLKGQISIKFVRERRNRRKLIEGNPLRHAEHLKKLDVHFGWRHNIRNFENGLPDEALMEKLQPHQNLREFRLWHYDGEKIGMWGSAQADWATFLPNLVYVQLSNCKHLQQIPCMSKMLHLKSLHLITLEDLEYIEKDIKNKGDLRSSMVTFFPSLESLEIRGSVNLKGWWRSVYKSGVHSQPAFPRLSQLTITGCAELTSFPLCLSLQTLSLRENNEALRITAGKVYSSCSSSDINLGLIAELDRVEHLKSLAPQLLTGLYLSNNTDMKLLSESGEVFQKCSSSLLTLEIQGYDKLESLSGGLDHLTALRSLTIEGCNELSSCAGLEHLTTLHSLTIEGCIKLTSLHGRLEHLTALHSLTLEGCKELELEDTEEGMPWKSLRQNLRRLKLGNLKVEILPVGMKYLTSLEHLHLKECEILKALPKWICRFKSLESLHIESCRAIVSIPKKMKTLKSLQKLKIYKCPDLKEKCDEHRGKHWRRIKHIPHIDIPW